MNINLKVITLLLSILLLSSCSIPRMFQVVISQGNLVDQEMLDKLEIGMTESQVKFVMGTPLISDTFIQIDGIILLLLHKAKILTLTKKLPCILKTIS